MSLSFVRAPLILSTIFSDLTVAVQAGHTMAALPEHDSNWQATVREARVNIRTTSIPQTPLALPAPKQPCACIVPPLEALVDSDFVVTHSSRLPLGLCGQGVAE